MIERGITTARVGCRNPGEKGYDGQLDDLRIYARALSAAEIATLAK
jgi:hypothetical protein